MTALSAQEVKNLLGLKPHPREGGWYVRTYEAAELVAAVAPAADRSQSQSSFRFHPLSTAASPPHHPHKNETPHPTAADASR